MAQIVYSRGFSDLLPNKMNKQKFVFFSKLLLVSFISGFILIAIIQQAFLSRENFHKINQMKVEQAQLLQQIKYYENLSKKYVGHRDIYFRLATLQYQAGDMVSAKKSLEKVLELDPNFEAARVLGVKVGL